MIQKSLYTEELGALVAQGAIPKPGYYFVLLNFENKWAVVPRGKPRALRVYTTKREAVAFAKKLAFKKAGEVLIQKKLGQVPDKISYVKK